MEESEGIKEIVNQVAMQAETVVMMLRRDVEAGPWLTTMASLRDPQRQRYSEPILKKLP